MILIHAATLSQSAVVPSASASFRRVEDGVYLAWSLIDDVKVPIVVTRKRETLQYKTKFTNINNAGCVLNAFVTGSFS